MRRAGRPKLNFAVKLASNRDCDWSQSLAEASLRQISTIDRCAQRCPATPPRDKGTGVRITSETVLRIDSASGAGESNVVPRLPPGGRRMVPPALSGRAHRGAGSRLGGDRLGRRHPDRGADRIGQDAGGLPRGDRPVLPGRRVGRRSPGDRRRVRLSAAGAHRRREREPPQAPGRDRRGRPRARTGTAERPGRGPQRRHPALRALRNGAQSPRDRRHDARVLLPPAHLDAGPGDAPDGEDGDRRRDPRPRPGQARLPPRAEPGAPGPARGLDQRRDAGAGRG